MSVAQLAGVGTKLAVVGMAGAMLAGCGLLGFENWEWRQKLILEVETPNGLVAGGSVVQVALKRVPGWLPSNNPGAILSEVTGEASYVEIAPGRYLFALLRGGSESQIARELFFPELAVPDANARLENFVGSATVPRNKYPRLVTFGNIDSPQTVRRVDPDDLAAAFGPGYRLKSVTLEITDEPVTKGEIEKILGWLALPREELLALGNGENPLRFPSATPRGSTNVSLTEFIRR